MVLRNSLRSTRFCYCCCCCCRRRRKAPSQVPFEESACIPKYPVWAVYQPCLPFTRYQVFSLLTPLIVEATKSSAILRVRVHARLLCVGLFRQPHVAHLPGILCPFFVRTWCVDCWEIAASTTRSCMTFALMSASLFPPAPSWTWIATSFRHRRWPW